MSNHAANANRGLSSYKQKSQYFRTKQQEMELLQIRCASPERSPQFQCLPRALSVQRYHPVQTNQFLTRPIWFHRGVSQVSWTPICVSHDGPGSIPGMATTSGIDLTFLFCSNAWTKPSLKVPTCRFSSLNLLEIFTPENLLSQKDIYAQGFKGEEGITPQKDIDISHNL